VARANAVDDHGIESLVESFRRLSKNVHRSKSAKMSEPWMVAALIDAGGRFHKIPGRADSEEVGCLLSFSDVVR